MFIWLNNWYSIYYWISTSAYMYLHVLYINKYRFFNSLFDNKAYKNILEKNKVIRSMKNG